MKIRSSLGMSAKEVQSAEGKKGSVEGDVLELDLGKGAKLSVTFEDEKASELRYSFEHADIATARKAFDALAVELTKAHGKPTSVKKNKMQSWNVGPAERVYVTCYEQKGNDMLGEPDRGIVQIVMDPYPE